MHYSHSKLDCDSSGSLSDCSVCFAVPVINKFSALVMEEVPQDPQYLEPPDPVDLVPSQNYIQGIAMQDFLKGVPTVVLIYQK